MNPFKIREQKRKWANQNPWKVIEANRVWRAANESKVRRQAKERMRRYRANLKRSRLLVTR
jgi:hypothetical protein